MLLSVWYLLSRWMIRLYILLYKIVKRHTQYQTLVFQNILNKAFFIQIRKSLFLFSKLDILNLMGE
jgi:hypothetical protein